VFVIATLAGCLVNLFHVNPIQAMVWSAVINGVLAPPLLLAVFLVACDRRLMHGQPSSLLTRSVVLLACLVMSASVVALALG
jgi:Mn2+/Fe2+ NRAMP family transporter